MTMPAPARRDQQDRGSEVEVQYQLVSLGVERDRGLARLLEYRVISLRGAVVDAQVRTVWKGPVAERDRAHDAAAQSTGVSTPLVWSDTDPAIDRPDVAHYYEQTEPDPVAVPQRDPSRRRSGTLPTCHVVAPRGRPRRRPRTLTPRLLTSDDHQPPNSVSCPRASDRR